MMSTREHAKRHKSRHSCIPRPSPSVFSRIRRERSRSPRQKSREKEGDVFKRLGNREKSVSGCSDSHNQRSNSRYTEAFSEKEAFKQMKQLIVELPMLTAPMEKKELIVYLVPAKETVLSKLKVAGGYKNEVSNWEKYEALIGGLRIAEQMGVKNLQANVDSRLVANQVNEMYVAKEADMICYLEKVRTLTSSFKVFSIRQIPRSENKKAGALSKIASTSLAYLSKFGLPGEIISDNGKQFRDNPFKDWCEKLCIRQHFASVKHPQTNGLVERANRSLGEGIKARLDARTEIGMPTLRTTKVDLAQNNKALKINIDLWEERREEATIREAKRKSKMEKYYNSKVRSASFKLGDLVYRNNDASRA
nr:reverse transcriptase domain-containing protein [Tanacetum cinerariifolium]